MIGDEPAPIEVNSGDRSLSKVGVAQRPDQLSHRSRDLTRVEQRRGHLVEEGGEQVIVVAVDERHVDRRVLETPRARQPAKARARDDDAGAVHCAG